MDVKKSISRSAVAALVLATLVVFACALTLLPGQAYAKSFSMPQTNIEATVNSSGDLEVVEQRHFDFDGLYHAVWWDLSDNLPSGCEVLINGVRIGGADATTFQSLDAVDFQASWRTSGYAPTSSYSFDSELNTLYVFFNKFDTEVTIEISYTLTNFAQVYSDVGEVYWQFVGSGWDEPSRNVTLDLSLPILPSTMVIAGDNVRAWGHGPLDATVEIGTDGVVHYQIPSVDSDSFAEARAVMPPEWFGGVDSYSENAHFSESRLDSILKEEQEWADQANAQRAMQVGFILVVIVICLALLAWAFHSFWRYGKELKPTFIDEYWRDVPVAGEHPAVVGRVWRFGKESSEDFTATIMHLANIGALLINKGSYEKSGILGTKMVEDYYLTRVPEVENALNNDIDCRAMSFIFDTIGGGKPSIWLASIKLYAEANPEEFRSVMNSWQGVLTAATTAGNYIESYSESRRISMKIVSWCVFVISFVIAMFIGNYLIVIPCLITTVILLIVSRFMSRRTQKGADAYARCKALKKWLTEFSALDERPVTDVKVWGEFMVYAYLFGVAEQAMSELRKAVPELFVVDQNMVAVDSYVPWYVWYSAGYGAGPLPDLASAFDTSLADSLAAISSALDGASSSGGGFGGGFSGGGGGGFGGGGGGAR